MSYVYEARHGITKSAPKATNNDPNGGGPNNGNHEEERMTNK